LRYTVVRSATDGKKYVLLGPPPNSLQQPERVGSVQLNIQEGSDMDALEQLAQEGTHEEDTESNWNEPITAAVNESSAIMASKKSLTPESTVVS